MSTGTLRTISLAMLVVAVGACGTGDAADAGPTLQTVLVTRGDLSIRAEATGTVEPIRTVEVKSKASGEVLRLHADVGDEVEPGAPLADIDPRDVQNRFDQMSADLNVAVARLQISEAQLERSDKLLAAEVITPQEHEGARLEYANSQASHVKAQTNFDLAELQLNDVRIRAPMRGTIITKSVEEGAVIQSASGSVSGGTTLFTMADLLDMQVRTLVDETDMGEIKAGLEAVVHVEAFPDRTFRGTVLKIEPQATVEQNITMFPVIVSIDNRAGLLKPGMNAEVEVLIDEALGVVLVPNNAIVQASDVGPAAMALGLDIEDMDLTEFTRAGRGGFGGGRGQRGGRDGAGQGQGRGGDRGSARQAGGDATRGAPAAAEPLTNGGADTNGASAQDQGGIRAQLGALREQVASGEITQDSMNVVMQALAGGRGGRGGSRAGASFLGGEMTAAPPRESRPAVVFVLTADSVPEPRLVQIGLNDWDHTQIVSGVEEGDVLVVVGAAQLLAQQQAYLDRMRERMGGSPFGGNTPGGGRGGGFRGGR